MPHRPVKRAPDNVTLAEIEKIAADEAACLALFERLRFPDGLHCSACGASEASGQRFTCHRSRPGLFTCGRCRRKFTLTSGTAINRTRLPLGQWLRANWLIAASSKGVSARKLSEMLGITCKVAWHLGHRIRVMMAEENFVLSRVVEMDEIHAGAPPRKKHGGGPTGVKSGRRPRRPLVLTMAERGGHVVFQRIASHSIAAIRGASYNRISGDAVVATDALPAYRKAVAGRSHVAVKHAADEFVRRDAGGPGLDAHTNTAEAVHAEIRRDVIGVWHWISQRHLDRYLDEISWRHNRRDVGHLRRIAAVLSSSSRPRPVRDLVGVSRACIASASAVRANIFVMKRCDHLPLLDANPGKVKALREVLRALRRPAPDVAADQWHRFVETGRFSKMVSAEEEARSARLSRAKAIIGAVRLQMLRYQVVGLLESFIENRANDFRDAVMASSIDDGTRHQLLVVNKLHAWFRRDPIVMRESGVEIPDNVRHLARRIMHGVLARHRRPRFHRLNPWIDQRQARLGPTDMATHAPLWVGIRGMTFETGKNGRPKKTQATIKVPLKP
jgi:hypothetical protein